MKTLARTLRRNTTDAERILWRRLRDRRLGGFKFRRQLAMEPYIVDFACLDRKLVVEVEADGGQHATQEEEDMDRTKQLERMGYQILRFRNHEILNNTESVLDRILERLNRLPHPYPLPEGEGVRADVRFKAGRTRVMLGVGCDRGTPLETLEAAVAQALAAAGVDDDAVHGLATIDKKSDESCIQALAERRAWPLQFFTAEELAKVPVPNPSATVMKYMGTPAVAEAAALLAAKAGIERLLVEKHKHRGVDGRSATVSIARMNDD